MPPKAKKTGKSPRASAATAAPQDGAQAPAAARASARGTATGTDPGAGTTDEVPPAEAVAGSKPGSLAAPEGQPAAEQPRASMAGGDQANLTPAGDSEAASTPRRKSKKKRLTKAQRKELKRLQEIEDKKLILRDKLRRELELSRMSAKKGRESWEAMCREIKIVEMREELQQWAAKTHRILEQKDEKIASILDEIKGTEEMHQRLFGRHTKLITHIMHIYNELKTTARNLYEMQARGALEDFHRELNAQNKTWRNFKENAERIDHSTSMVIEHRMQHDFQVYLDRTDDNVNREIERRYRIRDSVLGKMEAVRDQLFNFVHNILYSSLDVHKYDTIRTLMERQRVFVTESKRLNTIESRGNRRLNELQRELLHVEVELAHKSNELRLELAYFIQVRKNIEHKMELDRQITFQKLKTSTSASWKALKKLEEMEKRGELLLSLAATCRKLQTEKEKVSRFGDLLLHTEYPDVDEIAKCRAIDITKHLDMNEEDLGRQFVLMRNFWCRLAMVEAEVFLLQREKQFLLKDNARYVEFIKSLSKADEINHIMEGMTIEQLTCDKPPVCATPHAQEPTYTHTHK